MSDEEKSSKPPTEDKFDGESSAKENEQETENDLVNHKTMLCGKQNSGLVDKNGQMSNYEHSGSPSIDVINKEDILVVEILEINDSHQENDSEESAPENIDNVSIIYEFPDDDFERTSRFNLPKEETISNERPLRFEEVNNNFSMNASNFNTLNTGRSAAHSSTSIEALQDRHFNNDCVIQIEEDPLVMLSSCNEISQKSDGDSSEADNSKKSVGAKKRNRMNDSHSLKGGSGKKTKCSLSTIDESSYDSTEYSSNNSDGGLADVEDNTESSSQISKESSRLSDSNSQTLLKSTSNRSPGMIPNLISPEFSNPLQLQKDLTCQDCSDVDIQVPIHRFEPTIPTSSVVNSEKNTPGPSFSQNQLKVKSNVTRSKRKKCYVCKKKLDLTAISCRCGGLFCAKHRYDKEHDCTFDYKAMGAEKIRKENPQIVAEKIAKL